MFLLMFYWNAHESHVLETLYIKALFYALVVFMDINQNGISIKKN
jgi:hypothetical protein